MTTRVITVITCSSVYNSAQFLDSIQQQVSLFDSGLGEGEREGEGRGRGEGERMGS